MSTLSRIMYLSRAIPGTNDHTVEQILRQAEANNGRDGITGALLAYGGRFLQVLEGPPDRVKACFARIRHDPRHDDVQILHQAAADQREFGPWAMRNVSRDHAREPAVAGFLEALARRPTDRDIHLGLALLRRLAGQPNPGPVPPEGQVTATSAGQSLQGSKDRSKDQSKGHSNERADGPSDGTSSAPSKGPADDHAGGQATDGARIRPPGTQAAA